MNQKKLFLVIVAVVSPLLLFIYHVTPDLSEDQSIEWTKRLAELESNLEHLQSLYRVKQEDVTILSQYLGLAPNVTLNSNIIDNLSSDTQNVIKNISQKTSTAAVRLPSVSNFLPHLVQDMDALKPIYLVSRNRKDVSIVLGIPSVKRIKQSYLIGTLDNLITNMNEEEQNETLIVVFIAETDLDYVELVAKEIEIRFSLYVENGLIEILSPSPSYYPSWDKLKITLNDPQERVKWRSKQNLDFAYMMAYAQTKGTFYVQLEDDILAKSGFITIMKNFALEKTAKRTTPWFVLDFCQLGFIGKMFKSTDLPYLITYFQMFYNDQPVDWLLEHLIYTKICNWDKAMKACKVEKSKIWLHFRPSLFQHIGTTSSLKGKVQKLKDKQFGKINNFYPHVNIPATVKTNIATYKSYTLQKAYSGDNFFWGLLPQSGDTLQFTFLKPTIVKKFLFRSGNFEHPSDRFDTNTTVEVAPVDRLVPSSEQHLNVTSDGYVIVGTFNLFGIAEGTIDKKIGAIKEMRLHVHGDSENWIILSEILIAGPKR